MTISDSVQSRIDGCKDAPADCLIRAIFDNACTDVFDPMELEDVSTAQKALEIWHDVDDLRLAFRLPSGERAFVYLVHQSARPHVDDVCDYSKNLDDHEWFRLAVSPESYGHAYTQ